MNNTATTMNIPIQEKLCLTVEETAAYSNIGIKKISEIINNPMCDFVLHVGKKRLVKRKEFEKYIKKTLEV